MGRQLRRECESDYRSVVGRRELGCVFAFAVAIAAAVDDLHSAIGISRRLGRVAVLSGPSAYVAGLLLLLLLSATRIVGAFDSSIVAIILQLQLLLLLRHGSLTGGFGDGLLAGVGNILEDGAAAWSVFEALPTDLSDIHEDGSAGANMGSGGTGSAAMKPVLLLVLLADSSAQMGNGTGDWTAGGCRRVRMPSFVLLTNRPSERTSCEPASLSNIHEDDSAGTISSFGAAFSESASAASMLLLLLLSALEA